MFKLKEKNNVKAWVKNIALVTIGLLCIVFGGRIVVDNAKQIAEYLKIDSLIIGLTIVAIGTSLPELVTSIVAARKGENDIAIANVIGSNIYNVLLILGLSSIIRPLNVATNPNFIDLIIMTFTTVLFYIFVFKNKSIKRWQGITLLILYIAYVVYIILRSYLNI